MFFSNYYVKTIKVGELTNFTIDTDFSRSEVTNLITNLKWTYIMSGNY